MMNGNLSFFKKVAIVFGSIGAVLTVMISWQAIEVLPRWAWKAEVDEVASVLSEQIAGNSQFAVQTRVLILGQEWERLDREIAQLEEKGSLTVSERELLSKKRLRKSIVSQQMNALADGS